jgi:hypothetical protein
LVVRKARAFLSLALLTNIRLSYKGFDENKLECFSKPFQASQLLASKVRACLPLALLTNIRLSDKGIDENKLGCL